MHRDREVSEHLALHFIANRHAFTNLKYYELLSPEEHFSGSPIFRDESPYSDTEEIKRDNFFGRIRSANMRDIISSRKVNRLRGAYSGNTALVDAAMLLRDEDIDAIPRTVSDGVCRHAETRSAYSLVVAI